MTNAKLSDRDTTAFFAFPVSTKTRVQDQLTGGVPGEPACTGGFFPGGVRGGSTTKGGDFC